MLKCKYACENLCKLFWSSLFLIFVMFWTGWCCWFFHWHLFFTCGIFVTNHWFSKFYCPLMRYHGNCAQLATLCAAFFWTWIRVLDIFLWADFSKHLLEYSDIFLKFRDSEYKFFLKKSEKRVLHFLSGVFLIHEYGVYWIFS